MHPVHLSVAPDNATMDVFCSLDTAISPTNTEECEALDTPIFCCYGAVGVLIWAMFICRPEISFPVVDLSTVSTLLQTISANYICNCFVAGTLDYGLSYWLMFSIPTLPAPPPPSM